MFCISLGAINTNNMVEIFIMNTNNITKSRLRIRIITCRFKSMSTAGEGFESVPNSAFGGDSNQQQHQQFLGDASGAIPAFSQIDLGDEPLPEGITVNHLKVFETLYKEHCEVGDSLLFFDFLLSF